MKSICSSQSLEHGYKLELTELSPTSFCLSINRTTCQYFDTMKAGLDAFHEKETQLRKEKQP